MCGIFGVYDHKEASSLTYLGIYALQHRGEESAGIVTYDGRKIRQHQGLGLANDSPQARPSIFNDDEEFGLLTRHDELLLRILYDSRLSPGMTEEEARPVVEIIAAELLGEDLT